MTLFAVAYLAGALTIVSPCILPILPFVFARGGKPFVGSTLPMLAGMAATFTAVTTLGAAAGNWAVQANELGRIAAIAVLGLFGLTLVSDRIAILVTRPVVALGHRLSDAARPGIGGALLLGVATGLVWAPCAGPVLGLVLTGAALQGPGPRTSLLLGAYAAGTATSLALALLAGARVVAAMRRLLGLGSHLRRVAGVAVLAGVGVIGLGLDAGLLARLSYAGTTAIEQRLLDRVGAQPPALSAALPVEGMLPALDGATTWLNSPPLTADALRGKVVLVNFWTYSCINCIRSLPYVRAWAEKYRDQGLVVIGVHSPEFAFEKQVGNVERAIGRFGLPYPVAVDNDFRIWRAFGNSYWPALYLSDAEGRIRYHHFGEGSHQRTEDAIRDLLAEAAGRPQAAAGFVMPQATGAQSPADPAGAGSDETYLGFRQAANFASPAGVLPDRPHDYTAGALRRNQWALTGNWTVRPDRAVLNDVGGTIAYRFDARDLHLVAGTGGGPIRFRVTIDGLPPGADHGADTDPDGLGMLTDTRLYQLVRQAGGARERLFEIRFLDPGAEAYAFTFG